MNHVQAMIAEFEAKVSGLKRELSQAEADLEYWKSLDPTSKAEGEK